MFWKLLINFFRSFSQFFISFFRMGIIGGSILAFLMYNSNYISRPNLGVNNLVLYTFVFSTFSLLIAFFVEFMFHYRRKRIRMEKRKSRSFRSLK